MSLVKTLSPDNEQCATTLTLESEQSKETATDKLVKTIREHDLSATALRHITAPQLSLRYGRIWSPKLAWSVFEYLEQHITYMSAAQTQVKVFNKWHNIPRKQVAFGDSGLSYKFSSTEVPALKWDPVLKAICDWLNQTVKGSNFNFVLVNRYANGDDYIGEHKDDEKDLVPGSSIASISLGQEREFVFRHQASLKRKRASGMTSATETPKNVTMSLEHGSLLLMQPPTNQHWYHSLPKRKSARNTRINLTFRRMQFTL